MATFRRFLENRKSASRAGTRPTRWSSRRRRRPPPCPGTCRRCRLRFRRWRARRRSVVRMRSPLVVVGGDHHDVVGGQGPRGAVLVRPVRARASRPDRRGHDARPLRGSVLRPVWWLGSSAVRSLRRLGLHRAAQAVAGEPSFVHDLGDEGRRRRDACATSRRARPLGRVGRCARLRRARARGRCAGAVGMARLRHLGQLERVAEQDHVRG